MTQNINTPYRKKTFQTFETDRRARIDEIRSSQSKESRFSAKSKCMNGINTDDLRLKENQNRRESILNSLFRLRKDKLSQITAQNQKIYARLNIQESHYSKAQMIEDYHESHKAQQKLTLQNEEQRLLLGPIYNFQPTPNFQKIIQNRRSEQSRVLNVFNSQPHKSNIKKEYPRDINTINIRTIDVDQRKENCLPREGRAKPIKKQSAILMPIRECKLPEIYSLL